LLLFNSYTGTVQPIDFYIENIDLIRQSVEI